MASNAILTEIIEDNILLVTLNRPDSLNAINAEIMDGLGHIFSKRQDAKIVGVILRGSGDKAFVAGADIKEFSDFNNSQAVGLSKKGQDIFQLIEDYHLPVVAMVRGYALGGGCELAMACHFRIGDSSATFGQPEVNLGIPPGYGGTQRLVTLIGKAKALEYLLTADMIKAEEALSLGLLNHLVEPEELMPRCVKLLKKIGTKGPLAVEKTITCVNLGPNAVGFAAESSAFGACFASAESQEGINAFIEKRKPQFWN
jgi:enoyl-CoA hydratase